MSRVFHFTWVGWLALFWSATAPARVEILTASSLLSRAHGNCAQWLGILIAAPTKVTSIDSDNYNPMVASTRQMVRDTYKELGTATDKELDHMLKEDDQFPPGAVIYVRVVNDQTGKVEGIMRVVSGKPAGDVYFNNFLSQTNKEQPANVPLFYNYPNDGFRQFLADKYPNSVEFGKLVFGEGANKIRVLNDLVIAAAQMIHMTEPPGSPPRQIVIEAVPVAVHLYQQYGFTEVPTPEPLDNGRVFMTVPVKDFYQRFVGNTLVANKRFDTLKAGDHDGIRLALGGLDDAFAAVSPSKAVRNLYTFGLYHRALGHYQVDNFEAMVKDTRELLRRDPDNREFRLLEVFAEAGSRFNWVTGKGDATAAIEFLDSPAMRERFQDKYMPEHLSPNLRLFVKGLVYLGADRIAEARAMRVEIEQDLLARDAAARLRGGRHWVASPEQQAAMRVMSWAELHFEPATGKGNPQHALNMIIAFESEGSCGLASGLYDYKAKVLAAMGDKAGAAKAQRIADGLR